MASRGKIKVLVLAGGPSSEHEVSLASAKNVLESLDKTKYKPAFCRLPQKGAWQKATRQTIKKNKPDVVFIAMHGTCGEDGRIQALLENCKVAYTGSGVRASHLAMDKIQSARIFRKHGLLTPKFIRIRKVSDAATSYPSVIKPADLGSSVGVSIVREKKDFASALKNAYAVSRSIISQEYIRGREVTCGVLENPKTGSSFALPPTEILPKAGKFYDYKSKYADGGSEHVIPPKNLSSNKIQEIKQIALLAHKIIGCSGMSRSDFILGDDGKLWILEINTIPGMTSTSLLPEAAKAYGINFPKLLDILIRDALRKQVSWVSSALGEYR